MRNTILILLGALSSAGCCGAPWSSFPMATAPDRACRTGGAAGYDVYIWSCYNQQRVVIYKFSGELSCQEPQRETASCGGQTAIEKKLAADVQQGCRPVPASLQWR